MKRNRFVRMEALARGVAFSGAAVRLLIGIGSAALFFIGALGKRRKKRRQPPAAMPT